VWEGWRNERYTTFKGMGQWPTRILSGKMRERNEFVPEGWRCERVWTTAELLMWGGNEVTQLLVAVTNKYYEFNWYLDTFDSDNRCSQLLYETIQGMCLPCYNKNGTLKNDRSAFLSICIPHFTTWWINQTRHTRATTLEH
jgi:hypothetical protein